MAEQYPPGFEFMAEERQQDPLRINGFAPGDRVQVVNEDNEHYGKFGKVTNSWAGCFPEICGKDRPCKIIEVELDGKLPWRSYSGAPIYSPKEITHVD